MNNNDIFKKLRVALQLRDDQIVAILELVDFRISKSELGALFRDEKHPNYMECGDQILRNFLNGLVIHLRGTKENPKNPNDVLVQHKAGISKTDTLDKKVVFKSKPNTISKSVTDKKKSSKKPFKSKSPSATPKIQVVEKVKYNNGKNKKA